MNLIMGNREEQFAFRTDFPVAAQAFFRSARARVHEVVVFLQEAIEIPGLVLRIADFSIKIFSFYAVCSFALQGCKQGVREIQNVFNWIKGLRSIDGFLNGPYSWKSMVLNVSSFILLILSTLTLVERLQWLDISALKVALAALPVFGILPFGGILSLALTGLSVGILLLTWERKRKMRQDFQRVQEKNRFWANSNQKIERVAVQLRMGYQQAKQEKWALRLRKLQGQERMSNQTVVGCVIKISKQILLVGAVLSGWGVLGIIGEGLEGIDFALTFYQFFEKRRLQVLSTGS